MGQKDLLVRGNRHVAPKPDPAGWNLASFPPRGGIENCQVERPMGEVSPTGIACDVEIIATAKGDARRQKGTRKVFEP